MKLRVHFDWSNKKKKTKRWREHVTLSLLVNFLNILTPLSPIQTMENSLVTMVTRKHVLFGYTQMWLFSKFHLLGPNID